MALGADSGWSCDVPTATCKLSTLPPLQPGQTTQVYLDVVADAASAGNDPVTVTVSADGLTQGISAQSEHGVQAAGLAARFAETGALSVTEVGNGLLSCPTGAKGCADARLGIANEQCALGGGEGHRGSPPCLDNNDWSMTPFNQAGDKTKASSAAVLPPLPPGGSVRWAGLYWSGGLIPNSKTETLKLRGPGATEYTPITADRTDFDSAKMVFQSYADVTDLVAQGGSGTWWAADPQVAFGSQNQYAGWSLVVVYEDPNAPVDQLTVLDGFTQVTGTASLSIGPRSGSTRIGTVAWEGDLGIKGDTISFGDTVLDPRSGNPADSTNVMDSSAAGALAPPNAPGPPNTEGRLNTFGTDVDSFDAPVSAPGNQVVTAATTGDTYFLGVLTVSHG